MRGERRAAEPQRVKHGHEHGDIGRRECAAKMGAAGQPSIEICIALRNDRLGLFCVRFVSFMPIPVPTT